MTHEIKLNENFCAAVMNGSKNFEVRYNDRGYQRGDRIKFIPVDDEGNPSEIYPEIKTEPMSLLMCFPAGD